MQLIMIGLAFFFLSSCTVTSNQKIVKDAKVNNRQISISSLVDSGLIFNK